MAAAIETKVQASTGAAAVSGLALWVLGHYVFKTGVPDVVASWIYVLVPSVLTFGAGYLAKHTSRPVVPPSRPAKTLLSRGGYSAGDTTVSDLAAPPPSVTALEAPPAAPEPPAAPTE